MVDFFSAFQAQPFFRSEVAKWLDLSDLFTLRSMFPRFNDQIIRKRGYNDVAINPANIRKPGPCDPDAEIFNNNNGINKHIEKDFRGWFYPDNIRYREYVNNVLHGTTYSEYPNASLRWDVMNCVARFCLGRVRRLSFWTMNKSDEIYYLQSDQHWENGKRVGVQTLQMEESDYIDSLNSSWYAWKFPHDVHCVFEQSKNIKTYATVHVSRFKYSEFAKLIRTKTQYMEVLYDDDGNFCEMACFQSLSAVMRYGAESSLIFTIKRCPTNQKNLIITTFCNGGSEIKYRYTCTNGILVLKERFVIPKTNVKTNVETELSLISSRKRKCCEYEPADNSTGRILYVKKKYKVDLNAISKKNPKGYVGMVYYYDSNGFFKNYKFYDDNDNNDNNNK